MGATPVAQPDHLERRGRRWLLLSFLACPCHLPVTLAVLAAVLGGTALGAFLRDNTLLAGSTVTAVWLAGTGRGLLLVHRASKGQLACPLPGTPRRSLLRR